MDEGQLIEQGWMAPDEPEPPEPTFHQHECPHCGHLRACLDKECIAESLMDCGACPV